METITKHGNKNQSSSDSLDQMIELFREENKKLKKSVRELDVEVMFDSMNRGLVFGNLIMDSINEDTGKYEDYDTTTTR